MADKLDGIPEEMSLDKKTFETTQRNARDSPESVSETRRQPDDNYTGTDDGEADEATINRIYR
jgi:hypothetical protein